jgi:hypothetical protein
MTDEEEKSILSELSEGWQKTQERISREAILSNDSILSECLRFYVVLCPKLIFSLAHT